MTTVIPAESTHFYAKDGTPVYQVPYADPRKGMRDTKLSDARKLDLLPSVTLITRCAAAPGLEAWKATQLLHSALTLPKLPDETVDDYAKRVIEDSKAQGLKARERGTELHEAIEGRLKGEAYLAVWEEHIQKVIDTLAQHGVDLFSGKAEHCFASHMGYGGKLDWHNEEVLCDFKTKDSLNGKVKLAYDEHIWQLSAYDRGLGGPKRRLLNVFIGCDDKEVRVHEWTPEDAEHGFKCFVALLTFWQLKNKFGQ